LLLLQQQQLHQNNNNINTQPQKDWICWVCGNGNGKSLRQCQSCRQSQLYDQNMGQILTLKGILNDDSWKPCEEQEYVWVLQNNSNMPLAINVKLVRVENPNDIAICEEGVLMTYEAKSNGEMCINVNARAPSFCGKYNTSWQMTTQDGRKIGPVLEMILVVKSDLKADQESKIKQMMSDFGFKDRGLVIAALSANKWNVGNATQDLLEQANTK